MDLRWEAWPYPGTSPYTVKVRDLQAVTGSGNLPKTPSGNGSVEIPKGAVDVAGALILDKTVFTDAVTPANDITSLIRVYRPGTDDPIHEWLIEDPVAESDDGATIRLSGRNIEAVLGSEYVEVWDWDASTVFQSQFPDHIYGGKNLIKNGGLEDSKPITEVYELYNDQTPASTFTLTLEGDTTAAIAFDATATTVETELENTSGITNCLVTGSGTEADPWLIEFVTPPIIDPDMTITDAGGLTSTLTQTRQGELSTAPFTASTTIAQGVNWSHGQHASGSPSVTDVIAHTGTYSLEFNGLNQYAGVQTVVRVKPGGIYQASMWARTGNASDLFRLVVRTPTEEFIASSTPFSGTTLTASTWTQFTIADITIPDGVTEVVMRFAYVGTGNPDPIRTDDWVFAEGQAAATPGKILTDLFDDAQTDHAPTREALTFINLDFTTVLDSDGNAWTDQTLSMTIKRRQSYLQMMRQFEQLGYEWRLVPTAGTPGEWDLQVYNPGTMGTDYTGLDTPAIVIGQGTLPSNVTRQTPVANYLMAEGQAGLTSRVADAGSITAVGRRSQGIFDRRFTDTDPLTTWVTQRLADFLAETLAPRVTLQEPNQADVWPQPLADYLTGDTVDFILADGATRIPRRVESISYVDAGQEGLRWTVEGGTATPYIPASAGVTGGMSGGAAAELKVLGDAVTTILEEFLFDEDPEDQELSFTPATARPAFTVRVAASDARAESKAAADFQCYGSDDVPQVVLADNICAVLGFGHVVLSEGTFLFATDYTQPATSVTRGLGEDATSITWMSDFNLTLTFNGDIDRVSILELDPCG